MKRTVGTALVAGLILALSCQAGANCGTPVVFPAITGPIQITGGEKEHLFASYYGINSFDRSQQHATVLETDIRNRLPNENDPETLGLVDLQTKEFIP
ncbi:MAG TPA: hypothetical protein P5022_17255, partial [Candidatus Paceibacterota bacterium]|nr:hypothetical protein [Candidatus Paceibacterota bacterium]